MPARFFEHDVKARLKNKRKLSAFLDEVANNHGFSGKVDLNYIFCSDEYLLEINRSYLDHDTYTDIITFDMSETENDIAGEIYISVDRVAENATKFAGSYIQELHRVIFHGRLHLCGFGDKKKQEKEEMRKQEDACLEKYFKLTGE